MEASLNHNFFTGREIVPYYIDQKITGGLQADAGTTEFAKFVGENLNISPMKDDHVMFGYTGTLGAYILNLVWLLVPESLIWMILSCPTGN